MALHAAGRIAGSEQLTHLSRVPEGYGVRSSYLGAVSVSAGFVLNVGQIYAKEYMINGSTIGTAYTAGTVTVDSAHATLNRRDIVTIDTAGTVAIVKGTAATNAAPPAIATTRLALAEVYIPAAATALTASSLTDRRQLLSAPRIIVKAGDESVNNSALIQDDDDFVFWADTAAMYLVEMYLKTSITTTPGINFGWVGELSNAGFTGPVVEGRQGGGTSQYTLATVSTIGGSSMMSISAPGFTIASLLFTCQVTPGIANGERFKFRWAQQTATAVNTTLSQYSAAIITRVPL